jgi:hypothetical protein
MTLEKTIQSYGLETCIEAYKLHKLGEGASTIGIYLGLTTNQADCAIDSGRKIVEGV